MPAEIADRTGKAVTPETLAEAAKEHSIIQTPNGLMYYPESDYPEIKTPFATPADFTAFLLEQMGVGPFIGVPCSIFKSWLAYLNDELPGNLIMAQNEGPAMGIAAGTFAATGKPAVVFMQNSGLNNAANPQTSLNALYHIPTLLLVSWRGEKPEAPEHNIMGAGLLRFLETLQLPHVVLSEKWQDELREITRQMNVYQTPVAVIVRKGFFADYKAKPVESSENLPLSRAEAIKIIKDALPEAKFISSTGFPSRDSYAAKQTPDFYMLGSMGHALPIALGVARSLLERGIDKRAVCLDGDGSALMHLGTIGLIKRLAPRGLLYVVLGNGVYESTGNQPLDNQQVDFAKVAEGLGIPNTVNATTQEELKTAIDQFKANGASTMLWLRLNTKAGEAGARVTETPPTILRNFSGSLE